VVAAVVGMDTKALLAPVIQALQTQAAVVVAVLIQGLAVLAVLASSSSVTQQQHLLL
jgi:hypothetical protein